ncbi:hypothetical protein FJ548_28205 [Mesorhizobium sp. B2-4-17]|nr:hypothetical protein FJ548_28205 [Mesorhizobium sp. B2-4-17]
MVSADIAVWRACATSSLMRLDSADGIDETAKASRAGGIELTNVLICNSGSLKPVDMTGLASRGLRSGTGNAAQFNELDHSAKKGRQGNIPSPACLTRSWADFRCRNDPII